MMDKDQNLIVHTDSNSNDSEVQELKMEFDPRTIEHLGIQMYSTLPPVVAELVSNSYDADASMVEIYLNDKSDKNIIIKDNGHGMTFQDINLKFLKIGRNRRKPNSGETLIQTTESGNRFVIGKKGIGKLSFFGIAKTVQVTTIRDGKKNTFKLDWDILISAGKDYRPEILGSIDEETNERAGTIILLTKIQRHSPFDPNNIAYNLAKSFSIFNEDNFQVKIFHNNENGIIVKNEMRYDNIDPEFEWIFPMKGEIGEKYEYADKISGKIISGKETVPAAMKGVSLFSRGKLVNEPEFYDEKATSFGYSYLTGWLNIDFIDEWKKDVISTNRKSLNWEEDETAKLKNYLTEVIKYIYKDQRRQKKLKQIVEISKNADINLDQWHMSLPTHERKLATKMTDAILNSEGLPTTKQAELVKFIKDTFQFEAFKEFANDLEMSQNISSDNIILLLKEWQLIEAREMYKLATGRIQTIKTFGLLIKQNAKEVQQIHPFFEKFPWILDPRINMFRHEVRYVELLKENYPEKKLNETNRRIDFLCTSVANHKFIIELKRPHHKITSDDISQAKDYRSYIEVHCGTDKQSPNIVIAYVIGGSIAMDDRITRDEIESMSKADKVYVKTYLQLLTDAENYHREFLDRYYEFTG